MAKIAGKYQYVESKNFEAFLKGLGVPEEYAKKALQGRGPVEISVDGDTIEVKGESLDTVYKVGQEVDEKKINGTIVKSLAKLNGNILTISSKAKEDTPESSKVFTFSDDGLNLEINAVKNGKTYSATLIYKRV